MARPSSTPALSAEGLRRLLVDIGVPPPRADEAIGDGGRAIRLEAALQTAGVVLHPISLADLESGREELPCLACLAGVEEPGRLVVLRDAVRAGVLVDDGDGTRGRLLPWRESEAELGEIFALRLAEPKASFKQRYFDLAWFGRITGRYRTTLMLVLAASAVINLLSLAVPLVLKVIIDRVVTSHVEATVYLLAAVLFAVALFQSTIGLCRSLINTEMTLQAGSQTTGLLFGRIFRLPLERIQASPVGEIAARIGSADAALGYVTRTRITTVFNLLFAGVFAGALLLISPMLTLIVAAAMPLHVALHLGLGRSTRKRIERQFAAQAKLRTRTIEYLAGVETLKALNATAVAERELGDRVAQAAAENESVSRLHHLSSAGASLLTRTMEAAVILVGALLVMRGEMTLGGLVAFYIIMGRIRQPLLQLSGFTEARQKAKEAAERLKPLMEAEEEGHGCANRPLPQELGSLELRAVSFRYSPETPFVLASTNLAIEAGARVALVGCSGSGKSTLLKILSGMLTPTEGVVTFGGIEADAFDPRRLRDRIGYVNQGARLFEGTVRSNLEMGAEVTEAELWAALECAQAHEMVAAMPGGLDAAVREGGSNLSGGQCQRLAFARVLLRRPEVLLLDEATSALDVETERKIFEQLCRRGTMTIVFATHRLDILPLADRVVELRGGAAAGLPAPPAALPGAELRARPRLTRIEADAAETGEQSA